MLRQCDDEDDDAIRFFTFFFCNLMIVLNKKLIKKRVSSILIQFSCEKSKKRRFNIQIMTTIRENPPIMKIELANRKLMKIGPTKLEK